MLAESARARLGVVVAFLRFLLARLQEDRCDETAAWLTWVTLFALVPTATVFYMILSMIPAFDHSGEQLAALAFRYFVPTAGAEIRAYLEGFAGQAEKLTVVGSAMMVVSVTMMLRSIEDSFDRIWRVERTRRGLVRIALHGVIVLIAPLLAAAALLSGTYLMSIEVFGDEVAVIEARSLLLRAAPALFGFAACTLLYWVVPNRRVSLKHAAIGGALTSSCYMIGKALFTFVVQRSSYTLVYGAFAALPLFMLWLHLSWLLLLAGAQFVHTLGYHATPGPGVVMDDPAREEPPRS